MTTEARTHSNGGEAKAMADNVKERVGDGVAEAREAVEDFTERAQAELTKVSSQATDFVRERPGTALIGAVGLGILIGMALRNR